MIDRRSLIAGAAAALIDAALPHELRAQARPLVARHPRLAALPWLDLGGRPTPIRALPELAQRLQLAELLVKDDGVAGDPYGGSKARKLELLLGAARRDGHASVLTYGGVGSNHALATAIHCRRAGLRCHLALLHEPPSAHARVHLLAETSQGALLHAGSRRDVADGGARLLGGEEAYVIPMGGSSPLGDVGYVDGALELASQRGPDRMPDAIYVAVGTCGTAAGIGVGLNLIGARTRLIGVRVSSPASASPARVAAEARGVVELLRRTDPRIADVGDLSARFELDAREAAPGYARASAAGERATRIAAEHGLALDPTYTAKAFAALLRRAPAHRGERVLFWNTYDAREVDVGAATVGDLPPRLRAYAAE
ncbi:MAG: 1-aminocyclopropane-1-carboxylate deaminase/D-cysteine desulfhydrase [Sandaracinaceae bacterium]